MISDGNGVGSNYATRLYSGQQNGGFGDDYVQPFEAFPSLALVKTYNVNTQTPDSAGTGTAMMSGIKTKAGLIGVNEQVNRGDCASIEGNTVATMNELMSDMGKATGVVSTARITHATPAANRTGETSLAKMTRSAIKALTANGGENGFFLQVEAGRVDHANHVGNAARMVSDGKAFADAVALADAMTNDSDTLIIVTADHEHAVAFNGYCGRGSNIQGLRMGIDDDGVAHTGEPELAKDGKPYTIMGYLNGAGTILRADQDWAGARPELTQEEATDVDYVQQALIPRSSESHSGEDVAVYAKGPWAHLLEGTIEQNVIFHVMHHAATK